VELGTIQELMESIKTKGFLSLFLLDQKGPGYEIIAGERRYFASKTWV